MKFADNKTTLENQYPFLQGPIREIVSTQDGKCIVALGDKAVSLNPDSGSAMGDVLGNTGKILCAALTKDKVLFSTGESGEILRHDGIPFKG